MTLQDTITAKLSESMKNQDQFATEVLRMAKSALIYANVAKADHVLTPEDEISVIQKEIKKRKDSAQMYTDGNRPELAAKETKEVAFLEQFLPEQASDAEIESIVKAAVASTGATSAKDMGKVMAVVMPQLKGKAANDRITSVVKQLLNE